MRTYFIDAYNEEETNRIIGTLGDYDLKELVVKEAIGNYRTIRFKCEKGEWKKIKKALNLQVTHVFSKIKTES